VQRSDDTLQNRSVCAPAAGAPTGTAAGAATSAAWWRARSAAVTTAVVDLDDLHVGRLGRCGVLRL